MPYKNLTQNNNAYHPKDTLLFAMIFGYKLHRELKAGHIPSNIPHLQVQKYWVGWFS